LTVSRWRHVPFDLTPRTGIGDELKIALGNHSADSLVLCAGVPAFGFLPQISEEQARRGIEVNLLSPVLVTRALISHLQGQASSDIVFIGSESALTARRRGSIYCAAKFGLRGFAIALRDECASRGVRVTSIHPGAVRTGFFDDLDFVPGTGPDQALEPSAVADTVTMVLESQTGTVFDEIHMSPLKQAYRKADKAPDGSV